MDLILTRTSSDLTGCFGILIRPNGQQICLTGEHAYIDFDGSWKPKIPVGIYRCVRGVHHLEHISIIETFQLMDVPGHSNILIHPGNFAQAQSDGCILVGDTISSGTLQSSRFAFAKLMDLQLGANEFQLTVEGINLGQTI